ncbi:MAG: 4'-phosphopantetheinyl transferase superfamily protein [Clostridia bacterium]|nr:4'-phosphopantetheinyl transferase superfamily protein [Clostridia bacterium]
MPESNETKKNAVEVYAARIPSASDYPLPSEPIFPPQRQAEIVACASEKARREKYFAWRLLLHAIEDSLGVDPRQLQFTKSEHGKWLCDGVHFSLSHSADLVCVALSSQPVGIDVEPIRPLKTQDFALKILSEQELAVYHATKESEQSAYLLRAWTRKESLFKRLNQSGFFSSNPKDLQGFVIEQTLQAGDQLFMLAVAADLPFEAQVHHHDF